MKKISKIKSKKIPGRPKSVRGSAQANACREKTKTKASKKTTKSSQKKAVNKPVVAKSSKEPQTMEELLAQTGYKLKGLKKNQKVKGVITEISKKYVLIDIGAKTEGIVANKEYEFVSDYIGELNEGDDIEAIVSSPENDKGQILLSLRKSAGTYKWDLFTEYQKNNQIIEVRCLEMNKGGVIARHKGVRGFVPASQFGREWLGRLRELQNKVISVKVIEVDQTKNRLIFSEKLVSEENAIKQQEGAMKLVKEGKTYSGTVSGIMPFGIFVRVDVEKKKSAKGGSASDGEKSLKDISTSLFLEGLVHISEISWQKVSDLNKLYKVGQKLEVKVLSINKDSNKLNLSIKQLQIDPWQDLVKKYSKDSKVKGKVGKLAPFGAFVSLEDGVEGLLHISKIPAEYDIKVDQDIDVYIESIDAEKKKISLGLVLTSKPVGYK